MDETEGLLCLGDSNWTICSHLSQFCSAKFQTFPLSYWRAISYYPRGPIMGKGNSSNLNTEWDRGFTVPRAFKLDHLQPIQPILWWKFSISYIFIMGAISYYPRGPIIGDSSNSRIGSDRWILIPGTSKLDHLQPLPPLFFWNFFIFFIFTLGAIYY